MRADPGKILYRRIAVDLTPGADPDAIDDAVDIADNREVYGDWPEIDTPCESPINKSEQCTFNAVGLEPDRCLYCGKMTG